MSDDLVKQSLLELLDIVRCRCHLAYTGRGMHDPDCECDSVEAVKVVADRIEELEVERDALAKKLAEADGALSICSASWGECNRVLDETKAKLAVAVWRFEHFEKYGDTNEARDFAANALAELKGHGDE